MIGANALLLTLCTCVLLISLYQILFLGLGKSDPTAMLPETMGTILTVLLVPASISLYITCLWKLSGT